MGTTHWRSNLVGLAGSETITGFDRIQGDDVVCGTLTATKLSSGNLAVTNYVKCGTTMGIFWGSLNTSASIAAAARSYIATPANLKGSLYMSDKGKVWKVITSKTASSLEGY